MIPTAFQVAGGVSEIGAKSDPAEAPSRELPDQILALLVALNFRKEEKSERAERTALVSERIELNERTKRFIEAQAKKQHAELLAQIEDCCRRGAEQEKVIDGLQAEVNGYKGEINDAEPHVVKS